VPPPTSPPLFHFPMHTIIHRHDNHRFPAVSPSNRRAVKSQPDCRLPHYECMNLPQALKLSVYVPGVDETGVELSTQDTDLLLTARKSRHVRVNWQALHLESAQRDYHLKLRLGAGYDFDGLRATIARGVLTIVLPKRRPVPARPPAPQRQVA
jgi:HSP20 family protein